MRGPELADPTETLAIAPTRSGTPPRARPATDRPVVRRRAIRRRRRTLAALALVAAAAAGTGYVLGRPQISPLRARIVSIADGQVGYRTDPPGTYCNRFSAYWNARSDDCGNTDLNEQWCADFAAWAWRLAGASFTYALTPGDINSASASFYLWGVRHGTWHAAGSGYVPQPGDVAVYGLDPGAVTAVHVAVVTGTSSGARGPDVVNGDGDRTGFSVVETGSDQYKADVHTPGGLLSGYVSPLGPATGAAD